MELTKEQGHEAYKWALKYGKNCQSKGFSFFMCNSLKNWALRVLKKEIHLFAKPEIFPELSNKKPSQVDGVWFDLNDYQSRFDILTKCIEETKPCT